MTAAVRRGRRNGVATAALVVSAAGAMFAYLPLAFGLSLALGVIGMALALAGHRASASPARQGRGHATATAAAWIAGFALLLGALNALATWNATRLPDVGEVSSSPQGKAGV